ncbi:MAG: hypothetical protein ACOC9S_07410 [Planctomycetota bacterium]
MKWSGRSGNLDKGADALLDVYIGVGNWFDDTGRYPRARSIERGI